MSVDLVVHSVWSGDDDVWVAFDRGVVVDRGTGAGWRALGPRDAVDGGGGCLAPGFIDSPGHGGGGSTYDDGADAITTARALHRTHGTTRAVVSLVTASIDDLARRAGVVADLAETDPTILGSHLEGPFLDSGHKGAHTGSLLRAPDAASVDRLLEAGRGTIRQVTIAPELDGAHDAIRRFVDAGVAVAIGHTDADADAARRAFDAGATIVTHAFNAMRGIHHRAPGPVVAALRDDRVALELIPDGAHVDLSLVAVAFDAAPGRIALVTDAMAAAGASDGHYELGGLEVEVTDGVARLADGGAIAGSTLTQDEALRNVVAAGVDLGAALTALSAAPARAIGRRDLGRLGIGSVADAVLLDDALRVRRVWVAGDPV